jgi:hypothetical protein
LKNFYVETTDNWEPHPSFQAALERLPPFRLAKIMQNFKLGYRRLKYEALSNTGDI